VTSSVVVFAVAA